MSRSAEEVEVSLTVAARPATGATVHAGAAPRAPGIA